MERHVSEKSTADLGAASEALSRALLDRSLVKWNGGMRSQKMHMPKGLWPFVFNGKPLSGEFLVSNYIGGAFTVITTPTAQWLVLTDELEQGDFLRQDYLATAKPFVFALEPRKTTVPDGATRHSGNIRPIKRGIRASKLGARRKPQPPQK